MDDFTLDHMAQWIDDEFGCDQPELMEAMVKQYETDPEVYDREGWCRCYDDMIASGARTL